MPNKYVARMEAVKGLGLMFYVLLSYILLLWPIVTAVLFNFRFNLAGNAINFYIYSNILNIILYIPVLILSKAKQSKSLLIAIILLGIIYFLMIISFFLSYPGLQTNWFVK